MEMILNVITCYHYYYAMDSYFTDVEGPKGNDSLGWQLPLNVITCYHIYYAMRSCNCYAIQLWDRITQQGQLWLKEVTFHMLKK